MVEALHHQIVLPNHIVKPNLILQAVFADKHPLPYLSRQPHHFIDIFLLPHIPQLQQ
jgi:hypothetical protein